MLSGDDLTIVLFLVGLAATFGLAAMSLAGWKHKALIALLFTLAGAFAIGGVSWPWLKLISPSATIVVQEIAKSPVSWFCVLIFGIIIALLASKAHVIKQHVAEESSSIDLMWHGDTRPPDMKSSVNIFRWYSLLTIIATPNKESGIIEQNIIKTTLLITFDKQTKVGTLKVTGENMIIPQHEVKEFNQRYAIIVFTGVVPVGTTKIISI